MKLEDFRQLVAGFMKHLNERNTQYKIAKRYGLVIEQEKPVIFHFEQYTKVAEVITAEPRRLILNCVIYDVALLLPPSTPS